VRRVFVITLAAGLALTTAGCGLERRHQVHLGVQQIASIASEASLMADDVARRRSKVTFVRVHGEELSAQAQHEAEKLNDDPVTPDLHKPIQQAIKLASSIGGAIDDLRTSPQDRRQARDDAQKLQAWAQEARKLADSI
jgi:hypothetical protein